MDLPQSNTNVKIKYVTEIRTGLYRMQRETVTVVRRAFYSKSTGYYDNKDNWVNTPNGYFNVPQFWRPFTFKNGDVQLLPHGFYAYPRVLPHEIISWEYDYSKE